VTSDKFTETALSSVDRNGDCDSCRHGDVEIYRLPNAAAAGADKASDE